METIKYESDENLVLLPSDNPTEKELEIFRKRFIKLSKKCQSLTHENAQHCAEKQEFLKILQEHGFSASPLLSEITNHNTKSKTMFNTALFLKEFLPSIQALQQDRNTLSNFVQMIFPDDRDIGLYLDSKNHRIEFNHLRKKWIRTQVSLNEEKEALERRMKTISSEFELELTRLKQLNQIHMNTSAELREQLNTLNLEKSQLLLSAMQKKMTIAPPVPELSKSIVVGHELSEIISKSKSHQNAATQSDTVISRDVTCQTDIPLSNPLSSAVHASFIVNEEKTEECISKQWRRAISYEHTPPPLQNSHISKDMYKKNDEMLKAENGQPDSTSETKNVESKDLEQEDEFLKENMNSFCETVPPKCSSCQQFKKMLEKRRDEARKLLEQKDKTISRLQEKVDTMKAHQKSHQFLKDLAERQSQHDANLNSERRLVITLRKQVTELQSEVELERKQNEVLKECIKEFQSKVSLKMVNMEYVKNIIVKYIEYTHSGDDAAYALLPVIASALFFTKDERNRIALNAKIYINFENVALSLPDEN